MAAAVAVVKAATGKLYYIIKNDGKYVVVVYVERF